MGVPIEMGILIEVSVAIEDFENKRLGVVFSGCIQKNYIIFRSQESLWTL
jgi:hypothetical protein